MASRRDKLKSRTFWLAVFCGILAAFWGTVSLFKGDAPAWLSSTMPLLIGAVIAYIGGNKYVASKGEQCGTQTKDSI